jgi:flagellar hook-associated protein 2
VSSLSIGSSGSAPLSFSGLASGLNTSAIISALIAAEKVPITHLAHQEERFQGEQGVLQTLQTSLQGLAFAASEFELSSLFEGTQSVSSSEPQRVSATITGGAGVGGYEVEVLKLANSAQRTFTFKTPAAEDKVTIDGHEYAVKAGETAKELAAKINADGKGTVFAAATSTETLVLSDRQTGATEGKFIEVSDPGGTLTEKAGTAKEGSNAEYKVDGVAGTSTSNTVTEAIAGVTLNLLSLTTTTGPVTISVQAPTQSVSAIEAQLNSFISTYNATVEAVQKQLSTKPLANPQNAAERATGAFFGDQELSSFLTSMRQTMYTAIAGLPAEMSSPFDIGVSTGSATGGAATSQGALQGLLKLDPAKLASALQSNPEGVQKMLQQWATNLQGVVNNLAEPGGLLSSRMTGEEGEVSALKRRISTMEEMLSVHQKALEQTYAKLEGILSRNSAQSSWLAGQAEQLTKSGL